MRIAIAADHNGLAMKRHLIGWLTRDGHHVDDRGAPEGTELVDYPPLCEDVCRRVADGRADRAIVVGGSGMGETVACNKLHGIRASLCHDMFTTEIARGNNDSNVLVLGAKIVSIALAEQITAAWLTLPFKGGRHRIRIDQIAALERGETLL
jgi:ribose 5-phosphate isomerase B